jgi:hypothetical protein
MRQGGTGWFGPATSINVTVNPPAGLTSTVQSFTGVSPNMATGAAFTAVITMQNSGTTADQTWNSSAVKLVRVNGSNPCSVGTPAEVNLPGNVANGSNQVFTISGIGPATAVTNCDFNWRLREGSSNFFGATASASINFAAASYDAQLQSFSMPATLIQGQAFNATVNMLNPAGSAMWDLQSSAGSDQIVLASQTPANNWNWGTALATTAATTVNAGSAASFSIAGRAPVATSTSPAMDWQLRRGSANWFGQMARPASLPTIAAGTKNSEEVELSTPASVNVGQQFTVQARMRNTGTAVWWDSSVNASGAFQLKHTGAGGENFWGTTNAVFPGGYVDPNGVATMPIVATAPNQIGMQQFRWRMEQSGAGAFGAEMSRTIEIRSTTPLIYNVTPQSGEGQEQVFTATFHGGNARPHTNRFLIWNNTSGQSHCWAEYDDNQQRIILYNMHTAQREFGIVGSGSTVQNEYCYVLTGSSTVSGLGTHTLTISLRIGFKPALAGTRWYWTSMVNFSNVETGWIHQGNWVVPQQVVTTIAPTSASVVSGQSQQFSATVTGSANTNVSWSDNGWGATSSNGLFTAASVTSTQNTYVRATPQAGGPHAQAQVTVQPAGTIVGITNFSPVQGFSRSGTWTVTANGGSHPVAVIEFKIAVSPGDTGGCRVIYYPQSNYVMFGSVSNVPFGHYAGWPNLTFTHFNCSLTMSTVSGWYSGNNASVTFTLDMRPWAQAGWKQTYAMTGNTAGNYMPDWDLRGTWFF